MKKESVRKLTGKSVLLVEDNEFNQEIAEIILKDAGIRVTCAGDGMEAVELVTSSDSDRFDLIFMDIQMPKLDGYQAARRIRSLEDKKKATIPIIAMTANSFEEDIMASRDAGMNGHLAKPVKRSQMLEVLEEYFNN